MYVRYPCIPEVVTRHILPIVEPKDLPRTSLRSNSTPLPGYTRCSSGAPFQIISAYKDNFYRGYSNIRSTTPKEPTVVLCL